MRRTSVIPQLRPLSAASLPAASLPAVPPPSRSSTRAAGADVALAGPVRRHPLLGAGDHLRTQSGRTIVVPRLTGRIAQRLRQLDAWLVQEALAETTATGAWFAHDQFTRLTTGALGRVDRDLLNEVLFGDPEGPSAERITPASAPRRRGMPRGER